MQEFCCMEEIHIGQQIKVVLETRGITVTEFAKRINKSRENIYSIFTRKTIDTGLLTKISEVLEFDFFKPLSKSYGEIETELQQVREQNEILKEYTSFLKNKSKSEPIGD
ncbi:MAG: helix-turn-helix transcriptional regulator [Flavobacteriales bacterium]|nr:helix-turn-helix transcriptional regulator [Flavobacteriales bacterium]